MNRNLIIGIVLVVVLALVAIFFVFSGSSTPAPQPSNGNPTVTYPSDNTGLPNTQSGTTAQQQAVQAAFQSRLPADNPNHTKLYATVIVGDYALQVWAGDVMGGEAVLKYNTGTNKWELIDAGGGAWSVDTLAGIGVPTTTAQSLLNQLPH
ncbi:MAG: hypothetical protein KGI70_00340 [Patescibacteria group bacterium]|nr:hypothetical protein [Patescibacteria group bacterium]